MKNVEMMPLSEFIALGKFPDRGQELLIELDEFESIGDNFFWCHLMGWSGSLAKISNIDVRIARLSSNTELVEVKNLWILVETNQNREVYYEPVEPETCPYHEAYMWGKDATVGEFIMEKQLKEFKN